MGGVPISPRYAGCVATAPAPINLDALAGIPMTPGVLAAWQSAAEQGFSDPARLHHVGRHAGLLLDSARASIAQSLGVRSDQIFFASSAPDGLRVAITGIFRTRAAVSRRIIAGAVESMAVLNTVSGLVEHSGASVTSIPVNSWGELDLDTALSALGEPAALACLQVANAEVGTRQPFSQLLAAARSHGVPVVADASGVVSHDPLPADFDVLVAPARDWGGPPGVAVVITHAHIRWRPEEAPDRGWIGGFPDIPAAVAAAVALEESRTDSTSADLAREHIQVVRARLTSLAHLGLECAGAPDNRLPHILTFTISGAAAGELVTELDKRGIYVAAGSACTADNRMPSHVLQAMGLPHESSIRLSLPPDVSEHQIEQFLTGLPDALASIT